MSKDFKAFQDIDGTEFIAPGVAAIGAFTDKNATFGAKGGAIGGGVGAGLGALVGGPMGAQIGNMLGSTVGQLIGGGKDKRLADTRMASTMNRKYGELNVAYNANPYGSGSTFYAEDGLVAPGVGETMQVNIEKDELLVDPSTMTVVQSFDTKRYKKHAKDKSKEPKGNFIEMDASHVIIPRKKADAFKNGDRIARRSIIAQIMEDQSNNGIETNDESVYAKDGYAWVGKLSKDKIKAQQNYLVSKGAKIDFGKGNKNLGTYGPQTAAAIKQYGLMPELGVSPVVTGSSPIQQPFDVVNLGRSVVPQTEITVPYKPNVRPNVNGINFTEKLFNSDYANPLGSMLTDDEVMTVQAAQIPEAVDTPFNNSLATTSGYTQPKKREKQPLKQIDINAVKAARAMNFLPTAVGLMQAGQNDPFLQYDDNAQLDSAKAMIGQIPIDENTEASRAAIAQGQAAYLKQMRNVNSPSTRAEVADYMLKSQTQAGIIEQDKENRRTQRIGQKLGLLADMEQKQGADRLQARNKFALESSQDRAVRQGLIHSAISEGAVNFGKSVMDEEIIDIANSMLRFNKVNVGGGANVIGEDTDAVNQSIANVASILLGPMATGYQVPFIPGVSRGVPLVNGSAALPGIGGVRGTTKPKVGAPATANRLFR